MIKIVSHHESVAILISYGYSRKAAEALTILLWEEEEESQKNYILGPSVLYEWEEFPSFQAAQAAVNGAYIPKGIHFPGGFLMRK